MNNGYVLGHSPPWPVNIARGISNHRKWEALLAADPKSALVDRINAFDLTPAHKWVSLVASLEYPKEEASVRNVCDILYSLKTGWHP